MSRILVISSCAGKKKEEPANKLRLDDFRDPERLARRESELRRYMLPAMEMYEGQQHKNLRRGVCHLRSGLWNVNHVDETWSGSVLPLLEAYVTRM